MAAKLPLEGIRVLDFGWRAVAPISARMLSWGGAEVIRIESATRHDGARQMLPMTPGIEGSFNVSAWFNNYNTNKLSDLPQPTFTPKGREMALRLVPLSDIVVENFSAGTIDKMGLGYEALKRLKPDIIMASHSLGGLSGPWKHVKGHGPMAAAMGGMHYLSGYADADPISPGQAFTDFAVNPPSLGICAPGRPALPPPHRQRPVYIDLSQYESIVHTSGTAFLEYTALGKVRERTGNRSPHAAPQGVYPCLSIQIDGRPEDRWCAISVSTDEEWHSLCRVIGQSELADDSRFSTFEARKRHEDEIDTIISTWTSSQSAEDVMQRLQDAGVASGVVQNAKDLLTSDPQMAARGHYRQVVHAEAGRTTYDGPPFTLSESTLELRPAPLLGEHNDYVFKELLSLTDDEITQGYVEGFIA